MLTPPHRSGPVEQRRPVLKVAGTPADIGVVTRTVERGELCIRPRLMVRWTGAS